MNFLASTNSLLLDRYWGPLSETGESKKLESFQELLWRAANASEGIVLIDIALPDYPGISGVSSLKHANPDLKILLLAPRFSPADELAALAAGAAGSCAQSYEPEKVRQILATVADGGVWISSAALPQLLQRLKSWEIINQAPKKDSTGKSSELKALTPREREIVHLVAKGGSNKLIARELNITDRTVKAHLSIIFSKLKVSDRLQLALFARDQLE